MKARKQDLELARPLHWVLCYTNAPTVALGSLLMRRRHHALRPSSASYFWKRRIKGFVGMLRARTQPGGEYCIGKTGSKVARMTQIHGLEDANWHRWATFCSRRRREHLDWSYVSRLRHWSQRDQYAAHREDKS